MEQEKSELEKIKFHHKESQKIGDFIEWLKIKYEITTWVDGDEDGDEERLVPVHKSTEQLLADYFKIDLNKAEKERQKLLDEIREKN